ncbi:NAD(P)H-dependent glycerol-3-phosphate dehydrogenase [Aquibacillus sp. 3ASR75-11]|uniref:Glycerol-3-phosphate dehydrogenase [NAD(P)+] n=1 Tax=Terrihalobacillus insolitus TaxID=2950438 RepID=A0A9X3WUE9_9BACI|nr:NAD(P)H-dependent glycerol-3-phosphate dehydrogenase [Terrihalobacillus insolitus]MDC3413061.1 NAD(P)H-dependent glycerol-3-phosphate dehydrogenase [Terrihalobacillus insolitus]MDC3424803.1 NAD(P)H-dependent glycerol-3-phosphate dehydrogenase [Terrihalobacillus insolitus]
MEKIAVLGAGSWGTALSLVLADNEHDVRLWTHNQVQAESINATRENKKYLPNVVFPKNVKVYHDMQEAIRDVSSVVIVIPTKAIREVCQQLANVLENKITLIHATKGIEPGSLKRVSEMIAEEMPRHLYNDIVVLSGPSHAEEVGARQPTTLTSSSVSLSEAKKIQDLFINENFRVYTSPDVIGVELGGALKNIIALGAGISDGLGYGDNAKAALMTRGLAEIARLGTKMGANPLTFIGLSGVGDLIVTCTSVHSRNWRAGNLLGKGNKLDDVLEQMGMVVEGVRTTKAAYEFARKQHIDMPITAGIYQILFKQKNSKDMVDQLMNRDRRHEMEDLSHILTNRYSI